MKRRAGRAAARPPPQPGRQRGRGGKEQQNGVEQGKQAAGKAPGAVGTIAIVPCALCAFFAVSASACANEAFRTRSPQLSECRAYATYRACSSASSARPTLPLRAVFKAKPGEAGTARLSFALPRSEFIDSSALPHDLHR